MTRAAAIEEDWQARLSAAGLPDAAALLAHAPPDGFAGQWEALVKPGLGGRERWRWLPSAQADAPVYVKRYLSTPLKQQVDRINRQRARRSRAWWEYHQSIELRRRYVPVVRAIGYAEEMRSLYERRSAVLFEKVAGDAFDRVWPQLVAARSPWTRGAARHELTRCLARFVSAFHQTGMCHRDLYLCHIFLDVAADAAHPPRFTLIDLARTHRPRLRRTRWIIKDLSQLDCSARQIGATRSDRLRFLVAYLGLLPDAPRVRFYARRVVRKSDAILRRIARKSSRP